MKTTNTESDQTLNDLRNPGHGRANALDHQQQFLRAAYGAAAAASVFGAIGRIDLHAQRNGWLDVEPPKSFKALHPNSGRTAAPAGIGEPDIPDSVYLELGQQMNGNLRVGPNGEYLGGLARLIVECRDPATGQMYYATSSCGQFAENVWYTAAHGAEPRKRGMEIIRREITVQVWDTSTNGTHHQPFNQIIKVDAYPLNGWVDGPDQTPNRGLNSDFCVLVGQPDQPRIPMGVRPKFRAARPVEGEVLKVGGFGLNRDNIYLPEPLAGFAVKHSDGFVPGDYLPDMYFGFTSSRASMPSGNYPVIGPTNGDSGGIVRDLDGNWVGVMIAGTSTNPGWTTALDLTAPQIVEHREKYTPREPREVGYGIDDTAFVLSWSGPAFENVAILSSSNPSRLEWKIVDRSKIQVTQMDEEKYLCRIPKNEGVVQLFKVVWKPSSPN